MTQPITSDAFTTQFKMNLASMPSSTTTDVTGFALWYLQDAPRFPEQHGNLFGFQNVWNGVGIFVTHAHSVWRLTVLDNFGMNGYREE